MNVKVQQALFKALLLHDFQSKMTSTTVTAIQLDIPIADAYSLEAVGKHGFGMG